MKKQTLVTGAAMLLIIGSTTFSSCGSSSADKNNGSENAISSENEKQENATEHSGEQTNALSSILDDYLQLKNALAEDNAQNAANAGEKLVSAFKDFDKSTLKESQTAKYNEIAESATENAEHISKNASKIDHQREHLISLSMDIKDLIALIGTDKKLYQDFCPMANEGKGAIWKIKCLRVVK
jgi:hypothetical protein